MDNYFDLPEVSASKLGVYVDCPREYYDLFEREEGRKEQIPTKAMEFGTKFHMFVLEPEEWNKNYISYEQYDKAKEDFAENSFKQFLAELELNSPKEVGKVLLLKHPKKCKLYELWVADNERHFVETRTRVSEKELKLLSDMKHSVVEAIKEEWGLEEVDTLFGGFLQKEVEAFFVDKGTGLDCKTKIDALIPPKGKSRGVIIEFKTIQSLRKFDNQYGSMRRWIEDMRYHIQLYFNIEGFKSKYNVTANPDFYWVFVEKKAGRNYAVIIRANQGSGLDYYEIGKSHFNFHMAKLKRSKDTGKWSLMDYGDKVDLNGRLVMTPSDYALEFDTNPELDQEIDEFEY